MLAALQAGRGLVDNWQRAGLVLTLISGAHIPFLGLPYDVFALLSLGGGAPADWALQHCVGETRLRADSDCELDVLAGVECEAERWTPLDVSIQAGGGGEAAEAREREDLRRRLRL
jgi:hypothetical protein